MGNPFFAITTQPITEKEYEKRSYQESGAVEAGRVGKRVETKALYLAFDVNFTKGFSPGCLEGEAGFSCEELNAILALLKK